MSERFCGNCGGIRIGDNLFCIICGSRFSVSEIRKCPTCNQDWLEAPTEFPSPLNEIALPQTHPSISVIEERLELGLHSLARPIKWSDSFKRGKDCINCGCPDTTSLCRVCGFVKEVLT